MFKFKPDARATSATVELIAGMLDPAVPTLVNYSQATVDDSWFPPLQGLRNVRVFMLPPWRRERPLSREAVTLVARHRELRAIYAHNALFLARGAIAPLASLEKLQVLDLHGTELHASDLEPLAGMNLESLILYDTLVKGTLSFLKQLPRLRRLDVGLTQFDDDSIESIRGLNELRELRLFNTNVTDRGLEAIPATVTHLDLSFTRVTAGGMERLRRLPLRSLISSGLVTKEQLARFAEGMPGLKAVHQDEFT